MPTQQSLVATTTSPSLTPSQALKALGEAFSKRLAPEQIGLYLAALTQIALTHSTLEEFVTLVVEQCEFFPAVATLYKVAGLSATDHEHAAALEAWDSILQAIAVHGAGMSPVAKRFEEGDCTRGCREGWVEAERGGLIRCECRRGRMIEPPKWDERTKFAVRSVGGFTSVNAVKPEQFDFKRKAFIDAYLMAPKVDQVREQKRLTAANLKQITQQAIAPVAERQGKDASSGN